MRFLHRGKAELMVTEKKYIYKTDLMGVFNFRYIYNKQITAQKVLCTDFYSRVSATNELVFQSLATSE